MSKDNLIYKSNDIIEASYTLSVNEQRLLLACLSMLRSDEELDTKKGYTLTVEQSQDIFYTAKDKKNAYRDLKTASESLYDARIKLKSDDGRYETLTRWVSTVKFDNEEMTSTLYFHDQIKPYISQLHGNFTKYRLKWIAELKSKYSIRIYELVVSWYCQNQPYMEMEITEFRQLLDLGEKYKQHGEFSRRVIEPSVKEINEHTDFELKISFRKRGRAFRWIQLRFNQKPENILLENARKNRRDTVAEKKEAVYQAKLLAQREEEFANWQNDIEITEGMVFQSASTKQLYVVSETGAIFTNDFVRINRHFLEPNHIKRLIFDGDFTQVKDNLD